MKKKKQNENEENQTFLSKTRCVMLTTLEEGTCSPAASLPFLNLEMTNVSHDLLVPGLEQCPRPSWCGD